ncbi:metal ABC transporter substrate-binding protein [Candidatus Poriferisodalis sp.]|uniref:metal ABC transporter substrate-binding protein n=1 Tax=Candidatus Poriferisodalis sp. TaxID=3101277 RepID=UPI003B528E50
MSASMRPREQVSPPLRSSGSGRRRRRQATRFAVLICSGALLVAACAGDDATGSGADAGTDSGTGSGVDSGADSGVPTVVTSMSIWADVVENVTCNGLVQVESLAPPGVDTHTYEPSLRDRAKMDDASIIVVNGQGLEATLEDTLDVVAADGTPVFVIGDHIDLLTAADSEDDQADDRPDDESDEHADAADAHGHDHEGGADPHIWFDPVRISGTLDELADTIAEATGLPEAELAACTQDYKDALHDAHTDIVDLVESLAPEQRVLVTNHDSLRYFADRYGFRVVGTVIPAATTAAQASIARLEELAHVIDHEGVVAIFGDTTHASATLEELASQAGVAVVSLNTDSLGPARSAHSTYIGLLTTNAEVIVAALQSGGKEQ